MSLVFGGSTGMFKEGHPFCDRVYEPGELTVVTIEQLLGDNYVAENKETPMTTPANRFRITFADDGVIEITAYVPGSKAPESRHFVQEGNDDARLASALVWIRTKRGIVTQPVAAEDVPSVPLATDPEDELDTGV